LYSSLPCWLGLIYETPSLILEVPIEYVFTRPVICSNVAAEDRWGGYQKQLRTQDMSDSNGLVALIGDAHHSWTMVNALRRHLGDFPVVVEQGEPASVFWARRRKKLGQLTVLSMQAAERVDPRDESD